MTFELSTFQVDHIAAHNRTPAVTAAGAHLGVPDTQFDLGSTGFHREALVIAEFDFLRDRHFVL